MIRILLTLVLPISLFAQPASLLVLVAGDTASIKQVADDTLCCGITLKSSENLAIFDTTALPGERIFVLQDNNDSGVSWRATTIALYSNLKASTYTLRIYSNTNGALLLMETLAVTVEKDTTWWYIPAFVLYLLILSGAAVYSITISKVRNTSKIYTLRSEWTNRLHTDLGGDLLGASGRIKMAQQELKNLEFNIQNNLVKAQDILGSIERKLRFVFDLIDPKKNSLQTILNDLYWFAQDCFVMKNIELDYQNSLPENEILKIDLTRIEKLGLIAKEVVNNSYKYSEATHFSMHIKRERKGLWIQMTDNGKGFDLNAKLNEPVNQNGNGNSGRVGLKSLFSLAKEGLINLDMWSEPGKGTRATIFVPEL